MNVLKPAPTFEELVRQASGRQIPRVKQRNALALSQDPRIQQIVGALTDTSQAYEKALADTRATSAALTAAASHAGVTKAALKAVTPAPQPASPEQTAAVEEEEEDEEMMPADEPDLETPESRTGFMMNVVTAAAAASSKAATSAVTAVLSGLSGRLPQTPSHSASSDGDVLGAVGSASPTLAPTATDTASRLPRGSMADVISKTQLHQSERRVKALVTKKTQEIKDLMMKRDAKLAVRQVGGQLLKVLTSRDRDQIAAIEGMMSDLADAQQEYIVDSTLNLRVKIDEAAADIKENAREAAIESASAARESIDGLRGQIRGDVSTEMAGAFAQMSRLMREGGGANSAAVAAELRRLAEEVGVSKSFVVDLVGKSLEQGREISAANQRQIMEALRSESARAHDPRIQELYTRMHQFLDVSGHQLRGMGEITARVAANQQELASMAEGIRIAQEIADRQYQQHIMAQQQALEDTRRSVDRISQIADRQVEEYTQRALALENGQLALGNGQLALGNGQLALGNGQTAILAQRQTVTERALVLRDNLDGARDAGAAGSLLGPLDQPSGFAAALNPFARQGGEAQGPFSRSLMGLSQMGNAAMGAASSSGS